MKIVHLKLLYFTIALIIFSSCSHTSNWNYYFNKYKHYGFFATSLIAARLSEKIAAMRCTQWIAKQTNTDAHDLTALCVLSPLCLGTSYYMPNRRLSNTLYYGALIIPILRMICTSKIYNKIWSFIPFFGKRLTCDNKECQGICDQCKYRALIKELPFGGIAEWYQTLLLLQQRTNLFLQIDEQNRKNIAEVLAQANIPSAKININTLPPFPNGTIQFKDNGHDTEIIKHFQEWYKNNHECSICSEEFQCSENIVIVCTAHENSDTFHTMCRTCTNTHVNKPSYSCPFCRNYLRFYSLPNNLILNQKNSI